jgi:hypothetical protein
LISLRQTANERITESHQSYHQASIMVCYYVSTFFSSHTTSVNYLLMYLMYISTVDGLIDQSDGQGLDFFHFSLSPLGRQRRFT